MVNSEHTTAFRQDLLRWYRNRARDLPWRACRDPYKIWISEIMLQQTRVDQALPYFVRFVSVFPDVQSLASAGLDEVLRCWEGLGYYARARNLHRAARQMVAAHAGRFPDTVAGALELPGIGVYTAAAVTSIAFGVQVAAVDGNVSRVLSRVFGIEEDVKSTGVRRLIRDLAEELLDLTDPGDSNQSVMELGATVCTPKKPDCDTCPLREVCVAHRHNMTGLIPATRPRRPTPHHDIAVGIIRDHISRVLVVQRPYDRLLGGLWEFPGTRSTEGEPLEETCRRGIREKLDLEVLPARELTSFDHQYSHFRITMHAFNCTLLPDSEIGDGSMQHRWTSVSALDDFAMHRSARRISNLISLERPE